MVEETLKRYADDVTVQELVRLRVENERLREALRNIAMRGPDGELWNTKSEIWMIADAALQQKDSE